ncbi:hypothetical protein [Desulfoluna butyratoxydans]|uniref:p-loop containing nucleoside triphosphate hydrolase n=1 Tax=Desulfoluna butyratoxydans TaxID=231438 RepID=A0A4U8YN28_9BACT|nr:hypothetical protein [Desulfoluna butyratoxydans]VFQ45466.1 p-loop containing nucleoside triphosphate hydrolase [Desulfoluna butyratoxydans]
MTAPPEKHLVRKSFFGCNSAHGFHCFFDFFHDLTDAKITIIKGGPGTGKSTFLKQIADEMRNQGFAVEQQHCSLDPDSLDAIIVPEIKAVVTAATGHHVFDPKHPGAVDEIINLGRYWDEAGIRPHGKEIMDITAESDRCFGRAYRFLAAAHLVRTNRADLATAHQDFSKVNALYEALCADLFTGHPLADAVGPERHLFMNSITPEGTVSFMDTVIGPSTRLVLIHGAPGTGKSTMLSRLAAKARSRGHKVEYCHHPLDHHRISHLIIPAMDVVISTDTLKGLPREQEHDLNAFLKPGISTKQGEIKSDDHHYDAMIDAAMEALVRAGHTHGKLEQYYIPHMNFEQVDRCMADTIEQVLRHAEKYHAFTRRSPKKVKELC